MDWTLTVKLFAALFAIMSPLSTVPIFFAMTSDLQPAERRQTAIAAMTTVVVGSIACALLGHYLLAVFGIGIQDFRLAGGLIVLLIGLSMLSGEDHPSHSGTDKEKQTTFQAANIGVYPLAIPIMLGPGAIATILIFAQTASDEGAVIPYWVGLLGYLALFSIVLLASPFFVRFMSPVALSVTKRIMGMILSAIAAEMIVEALGALFPAWVKVAGG